MPASTLTASLRAPTSSHRPTGPPPTRQLSDDRPWALWHPSAEAFRRGLPTDHRSLFRVLRPDHLPHHPPANVTNPPSASLAAYQRGTDQPAATHQGATHRASESRCTAYLETSFGTITSHPIPDNSDPFPRMNKSILMSRVLHIKTCPDRILHLSSRLH